MSYRCSKIFQGITENSCQQMMECFGAHRRQFSAGTTICDYDQESTLVGILESGRASLIRIDIYGVRTILETLSAGDVFGEVLSFSGMSEDSISVVCDKDASVVFFEYHHITHPCSKSCTHHTLLLENMFRLISKKSMALSERIEVLSRRTIRDKLLCYFSLQSLHQNARSFELPFSISALADYICSDRSAMMREMKSMREDGLIETNGRTIALLTAGGRN